MKKETLQLIGIIAAVVAMIVAVIFFIIAIKIRFFSP
jgi:hypothetical protein